jgi:hypothetical protein
MSKMAELDMQLQELDEKLDEVEALIQSLPLRVAVKKQLVAKVYDIWSEVEASMELTPVDWN